MDWESSHLIGKIVWRGDAEDMRRWLEQDRPESGNFREHGVVLAWHAGGAACKHQIPHLSQIQDQVHKRGTHTDGTAHRITNRWASTCARVAYSKQLHNVVLLCKRPERRKHWPEKGSVPIAAWLMGVTSNYRTGILPQMFTNLQVKLDGMLCACGNDM